MQEHCPILVPCSIRRYCTGASVITQVLYLGLPWPVALAQREWLTELLSVLGPELSLPFAVKPGGGGGAPFPDEEESNKDWDGIEGGEGR